MGNVFEKFDAGRFETGCLTREISRLPWNRHSAFEGVELKHIITAADTGGAFSCHLVKVGANMKIGSHVHDAQTELHEVIEGEGVCRYGGRDIFYTAGTVCIIEQGEAHEVLAGDKGLYLFAKFIPALC